MFVSGSPVREVDDGKSDMIGRVLSEIKNQISYMRKVIDSLGWRDALRFRAAQIFGARFGWPQHNMLKVYPAILQHPVFLRVNSTDLDVYRQVVMTEEYAAIIDPLAKVIVDCGANVGLTSAYLLSRLPEARVVAIEPFHENAEMCRRNLAPYGHRAEVIEAAIFGRTTMLVLEHSKGNEWGVRVRPVRQGENGDITGIDIPSIGLKHIDILKVDIEGSEAELFSDGTERWLSDVSNIAIELHGIECEEKFWAAMSGYNYELSKSGELTICRNMHKNAT